MAVSRNTVLLVALVAVAIAAFASYALYNYLQGQEERVQEAVKISISAQKVAVASKDIPVGEAITAAQVRTVDWPVESLPAGTFLTAGEVVGRTPLETIEAGNPITASKLLPVGGLPGVMTYKIPDGHRAMTVGVDQVSGVAGFITPGSMVDVVLTSQPPGYSKKLSRIVLQNIPVLATGQVIEQKDGKPVIVPTVTMDVLPEEAERLVLANSEGPLRLLLRRAGDDDFASTKGSTITGVIREASKARKDVKVASAKTPAKPRTVTRKPATTEIAKPTRSSVKNIEVEVYRNTVKTVETFKVKEAAK